MRPPLCCCRWRKSALAALRHRRLAAADHVARRTLERRDVDVRRHRLQRAGDVHPDGVTQLLAFGARHALVLFCGSADGRPVLVRVGVGNSDQHGRGGEQRGRAAQISLHRVSLLSIAPCRRRKPAIVGSTGDTGNHARRGNSDRPAGGGFPGARMRSAAPVRRISATPAAAP